MDFLQKRPIIVRSLLIVATPYLWDSHVHIEMNSFDVLISYRYGVATISRLLTIIGLFCKKALYKRLHSAKETYHFKEPTNRSHPIPIGFT